MKALTLTQPWATLVAMGAKTIETRSWTTKHRGLLAIHAGKSSPQVYRHLPTEWPFEEALAGELALPRGCIIAVANLVSISGTGWATRRIEQGKHAPHEAAFGDYGPRRFAWFLESVMRLKVPLPCVGRQLLWDVPDDVEARIWSESPVPH